MRSIQTTPIFDTWFTSLKDRQAAVRVQVRIDRAERGSLGDVKPVGEACQKCASTTAQATGCISSNAAWS